MADCSGSERVHDRKVVCVDQYWINPERGDAYTNRICDVELSFVLLLYYLYQNACQKKKTLEKLETITVTVYIVRIIQISVYKKCEFQ